MRYTIEERALTRERESRFLTIEARDADDAISKFVRQNQSELVSFTPMAGRESIATVRRDDAVFLVRVYHA